MSVSWATVLAVGAATVAIKALGPAVLGGRSLPVRLAGVLGALGPAVLAALVVTQAFGSGRSLVLDARAAGLAAAVVAVRLRAPLLAVIVVAAVATALARLA